MEGSQDYDFAMRAVEEARGVGHIPKILYHWRMTPGSTAVSGAEKPGSFDTGAHAIRDTLHRRNIIAQSARPDWAQRRSLGLFALDFAMAGPSIDIIIPVQDTEADVSGLLRTLLQGRL